MPRVVIAQRLAVPFLVVVSLLLIVLGKADLVMVERAASPPSDFMAPILAALASPAASVATASATSRACSRCMTRTSGLREDNDRLMRWQAVARRLATENAQLRALTHYQPRGASCRDRGASHRQFRRCVRAQRAGRCRRPRRRGARPGGHDRRGADRPRRRSRRAHRPHPAAERSQLADPGGGRRFGAARRSRRRQFRRAAAAVPAAPAAT